MDTSLTFSSVVFILRIDVKYEEVARVKVWIFELKIYRHLH
ncbi:hypothetical protein H1P_950023 [Hyella patelloides LEGE 07179]|uniref:Uncharacterized protein n=1 Tax=Hyella patelloides LEGE 07179 TaxID=945734 RepID=A0A563W5I2_9CYAN|nr:hypothetical protein H1P_950023 [Hyella patelloides LEGE 07179]